MKRILALALSLAIAAVLITGCGNTSAGSNTSAGGNTSANPPVVQPSTDWPLKTINIVVGYTAGGDSDLNARLVAKYLAPVLGVDVIVTNTEGSSGMVAAAEVADANPDGYVCYWGHGGVNVTQAYGGASVDMFEDLAISGGILTDNSYTLCVASNTGIKNYEDLKAYCAEKPESLTIVANANSGNWYTVTNIEKASGMVFNKIEGAGSIADRIVQMLAGEQQLIYTSYSQLADYIENGDLNVIGSISDQRNPKYPDVPTLTELGAPVQSHYTFGFRFPKDTDQAILNKFEDALKQVSEDPNFIAEAEGYGVNVTFMTGTEYEAFSRDIYNRAIDSMA